MHWHTPLAQESLQQSLPDLQAAGLMPQQVPVIQKSSIVHWSAPTVHAPPSGILQWLLSHTMPSQQSASAVQRTSTSGEPMQQRPAEQLSLSQHSAVDEHAC